MKRADAGFTLLEVIVALAILSLAVVAAIQGFAQGLRLLKLAGDHQRAMLLAHRLWEQVDHGATASLGDWTEPIVHRIEHGSDPGG